MKTLLVMRHAKSDWADENLDDHDRPLNARGERDAPRMAAYIRDNAQCPDVILCSTALRARTTAEVVAANCGEKPIVLTRRLYLAEPRAYFNEILALPENVARAMVLGHNPGISEFLSELVGDEMEMPTAAVAVVTFPEDQWNLADVRGTLKAFWAPKALFS